jgi:hypothetical protein
MRPEPPPHDHIELSWTKEKISVIAGGRVAYYLITIVGILIVCWLWRRP